MHLCLNKRSIRSNSSNRSNRFERLKRLERFERGSLAGSLNGLQNVFVCRRSMLRRSSSVQPLKVAFVIQFFHETHVDEIFRL